MTTIRASTRAGGSDPVGAIPAQPKHRLIAAKQITVGNVRWEILVSVLRSWKPGDDSKNICDLTAFEFARLWKRGGRGTQSSGTRERRIDNRGHCPDGAHRVIPEVQQQSEIYTIRDETSEELQQGVGSSSPFSLVALERFAQRIVQAIAE